MTDIRLRVKLQIYSFRQKHEKQPSFTASYKPILLIRFYTKWIVYNMRAYVCVCLFGFHNDYFFSNKDNNRHFGYCHRPACVQLEIFPSLAPLSCLFCYLTLFFSWLFCVSIFFWSSFEFVVFIRKSMCYPNIKDT